MLKGLGIWEHDVGFYLVGEAVAQSWKGEKYPSTCLVVIVRHPIRRVCRSQLLISTSAFGA